MLNNVVRRARASACVLVGLVSTLAFACGASAATKMVPPPLLRMHYVGTPVMSTQVAASYIGQNHVYEVLDGTPPQILQINPDGTVASEVSLTHGYNAWKMVEASDGTLYTAVSSNSGSKVGYIYAWKPGSSAASLVAQIPNTTTVWGLSIDPTTGILWIGAQGLYSYDPTTGKVTPYGTLVSGATQVHAVSAYGGTVYAGFTPNAQVVSLNPQTGSVQTVATASFANGVDGLLATQSALYIHWSSGNLSVYENGYQAGTFSGAEDTPAAYDGSLYTFGQGGAIIQAAASGSGVSVHQFPAALDALKFISPSSIGVQGNEILGVMGNGSIVLADPMTWAMTMVQPIVQNNPGIIHAMYTDTNGSLWASVFLGGQVTHVVGHTFYRYPIPYQIDSFASSNGTLYMGAYTGGLLLAYNESQPWDFAAGNPKIVGSAYVDGTPSPDRAFALAVTPQGVYFGTIPDPGQLGGNLGYYNPQTGTHTAYATPVPNEGITSLAYDPKSGMLIGTTTTLGGGDVAPVDQSAHVFVWNPQTQSLVNTYMAGMQEWGALTVGPNGLIYGANPRAVFSFDPATGQTQTHVFNPAAGVDTWGGLTHMVMWNGKLFLLTEGTMYQINPTTLAATKLMYGPEQMTVDGNYLYVSYESSFELWDLPLALLNEHNASYYPSGYITQHKSSVP